MAKDIHVPARIVGGKIPVRASLGQTVIVTEGPEEYTGPVTVTPTESEQTLQTNGKLVISDISVGAIPDEYIIPTGTEEITVTENGTISRDVTDKKTVTVNVDVPIPQPTGTKEITITENGTVTEDVSDFASVEISVDVSPAVPANIPLVWDESSNGMYIGANGNIGQSAGFHYSDYLLIPEHGAYVYFFKPEESSGRTTRIHGYSQNHTWVKHITALSTSGTDATGIAFVVDSDDIKYLRISNLIRATDQIITKFLSE